MSDIGTLNEGPLHAALKSRYSEPGDEFEVALDRFVIDIKRGMNLIEIQTVSFASMGKKLDHLLPDYNILVVHPIAVVTYLDRPGAKPRKSPKKGSIYNIFDELVSVPTLIDHPNLSIDVVLTDVIKYQVADPKLRRGRGGFRTVNRGLAALGETVRIDSAADLAPLVPVHELPPKFTTADLAKAAGVARATAQKMAYCFRPLGMFVEHERTRQGILHSLSPTWPSS